jgi:hypothetical protein
MGAYLCMVPFTWILNFCMALMGNSSCFTALFEVTAFNWQFTMFYNPVLRLSSSSEKIPWILPILVIYCHITKFPEQNSLRQCFRPSFCDSEIQKLLSWLPWTQGRGISARPPWLGLEDSLQANLESFSSLAKDSFHWAANNTSPEQERTQRTKASISSLLVNSSLAHSPWEGQRRAHSALLEAGSAFQPPVIPEWRDVCSRNLIPIHLQLRVEDLVYIRSRCTCEFSSAALRHTSETQLLTAGLQTKIIPLPIPPMPWWDRQHDSQTLLFKRLQMEVTGP